jgi:hypothetical protein
LRRPETSDVEAHPCNLYGLAPVGLRSVQVSNCSLAVSTPVVRQTGFGRLSHRERDGPGRFHLVATSAKNGNSRHLAIKKDLGLPSLIQRNLLFSAAVPVGFQKIAAHLRPMAPSTRKPTCV